MEKPNSETKHEDREEESRENGDNDSSSAGQDESFMAELNLVLISSFLSLSSTEEGVRLEEEKESLKDHEAKDAVSRQHNSRRHVNRFKVADQRMPRFQTKIKDCRHCRRM